MGALISVCIPTFNRPALLKLAIESCLQQVFRPFEILIGDDSRDHESEVAIASMHIPSDISVRYHRNHPAGGQAANVNGLFGRASGGRLLLLHDDDVLCPGAIDTLAQAWAQAPDALCVYGKQAIIHANGEELPRESATWNARYFRVSEHAGPQRDALVAALWQQVPNDCYLVDTELARRVGYRPETDIGQCVDAEFAIRLAQHAGTGSFVFVDALVSQYRLTPASIARSTTLNRRQDLFFEIIRSLRGDQAVEAAKTILLERIGVGAALDAALADRPLFAIGIVFSQYYRVPFFSRWTLYRLLCAASPSLGPRVRRLINDGVRSAARPPHSPENAYGTHNDVVGKSISPS